MLICFAAKYKPRNAALYTSQGTILLILIMLLMVSYWKRRWFHSEPGHQNPYKSLYSILKFAKSHKHPLGRSTFTYSDACIPSRIDFTKERFGGPFTTEQVENVKTFFRIILVLFAVGPAFALEVPSSYFIYPLFGLHFHENVYASEKRYCTSEFIWDLVVDPVSWKIAPLLLLFPFYIWIIFSLLRKKVLKLFIRLGIGIFICLSGVVCLLIADVVGH